MHCTRFHRFAAILPMFLLFLLAVPSTAQTATPSTPAGHVLQSWLDAFNSGDGAKLANYVKTVDPKEDADRMLAFHDQTGGFDLVSIESSQPLEIKFRVKEKTGAITAFGIFLVKDGQPPTVVSSSLRALPPGAVLEDITLDAAERLRVLDAIYKNLADFYVYPDIAKKMDENLRSHQQRGDYNAITNGGVFADRLTTDMRVVSHDRHLGVAYNPFKTPAPPADQHGPSAEERTRMRQSLERSNCGFVKIEILPHNIGYLKFNMFAPPDICGPTVVAAMNFLANVDAIIFDLRTNGGGDPKMVAFIASYLFDQPTHLSDIYNRHEDSTTQYWTSPYVPGPRLAATPAFVLTSKMTFSGAEDFTYSLKVPKRVTVIGETTGGGAHPVSGHRIDDHFSIGVPFARSINLTTKTNWERTGVEPDIKSLRNRSP